MCENGACKNCYDSAHLAAKASIQELAADKQINHLLHYQHYYLDRSRFLIFAIFFALQV